MPPSVQAVTPLPGRANNAALDSGASAAPHDEERSDRSEFRERSEPSEDMERGERAESNNGMQSPRTALEAYTERLNTARVRAEFEATLMTVLTLNVLYMYYIDHSLIILSSGHIKWCGYAVCVLGFLYTAQGVTVTDACPFSSSCICRMRQRLCNGPLPS
eukprot:IDg18382t1